MIMITDTKKIVKNLDEICCDGVNIAMLVWKGNKFVEKKGSVCVFLIHGQQMSLLAIISLCLSSDRRYVIYYSMEETELVSINS